MLNKTIILMVMSVLSLAGGVWAEPSSDGSLFLDEFSGAALDAAKWDSYANNTLNPAVGDGLLTINTMPDGICAISTKADVLDFSESIPSQWVASMRFVVHDIETLKADRQVMLMMLCSGWIQPPDTWEAIAFDLRLHKLNGAVWLGWWGFDGTDGGRQVVQLAALEEGTNYTVTVHVKNEDREIDLYLDGNHIATKDLIAGYNAGNVDQIYPDKILVGTMTTPNIDMSIDYISVGVNQE